LERESIKVSHIFDEKDDWLIIVRIDRQRQIEV
jgi:hypothetical protein